MLYFVQQSVNKSLFIFYAVGTRMNRMVGDMQKPSPAASSNNPPLHQLVHGHQLSCSSIHGTCLSKGTHLTATSQQLVV